MEEKLTLKERIQVIAFAAFVNILIFGLLFVLDERWFGLVAYTGLIFGVVVYAHAKDFKTVRSILVLGALFSIHVAACVVYLRGANRFPNFFFLFFAPLEAGIVDLILTTVGGVRPRLRRQKRDGPTVSG